VQKLTPSLFITLFLFFALLVWIFSLNLDFKKLKAIMPAEDIPLKSPTLEPGQEPRVNNWIGRFISMEFVDRAQFNPQASIAFELLFQCSATPKCRANGYFPFRTGRLRRRGIARSTIRNELHRLERLKLIEIKPYKSRPGRPVMIHIPDRFFGARQRKVPLS
jgi:hypothetical protein